MDMKEIKKELEVILKDIDSWCGPKGHPPEHEDEVRRRELVLWKQAIIYKIMDSKRDRDKRMEDFNTELLCCVNSFLNSYQT